MYKLSFCRIFLHESNIAELVVKGGVEVTDQMIEELFYFIKDEMHGDVSIIFNKATQYKYTFAAQVKFSLSDIVQNVAVIAYDEKTESLSEYLKQNFNKSGKRVRMFKSRDEALLWLRGLAP